MEKWWGSISAQTKSDTKIVRRAEENIAQTKKKSVEAPASSQTMFLLGSWRRESE